MNTAPVNACKKAADLFYDEVNAFFALSSKAKQIFCCFLYDQPEFSGFFEYVKFRPYKSKVPNLIFSEYAGKICENADLAPLIRYYPSEDLGQNLSRRGIKCPKGSSVC